MIPWNYIFYTGIILSAAAGSPILYLVKKFVIDEKTHFRLDWDGILERAAITALILTKTYFILLVPIIIAARAFYYVSMAPGFRENPDLFGRSGSFLPYQKVKLKSVLGVDLTLSPAIAIVISLIIVGIF
ncbi:MAG: hypothetical protein NT030_01780 [Candidatus Saganbacteria bacterium]|nr:hypothetical protein [Candidatus Saganbacteria bacterium]